MSLFIWVHHGAPDPGETTRCIDPPSHFKGRKSKNNIWVFD